MTFNKVIGFYSFYRETVDGSCAVLARGDWLPRAIFGRCFALCATIRMLFLSIYLSLQLPAEVVIVDQVVSSDFNVESMDPLLKVLILV